MSRLPAAVPTCTSSTPTMAPRSTPTGTPPSRTGTSASTRPWTKWTMPTRINCTKKTPLAEPATRTSAPLSPSPSSHIPTPTLSWPSCPLTKPTPCRSTTPGSRPTNHLSSTKPATALSTVPSTTATCPSRRWAVWNNTKSAPVTCPRPAPGAAPRSWARTRSRPTRPASARST